MPASLPPMDRPFRLAFIGQSTFFRACVFEEHSDAVETAFFDFRAGADGPLLRARLDAFAPDAVGVFRPETLPLGLFADVPAPVLGFLTEPVSRDPSGAGAHWDLEARRRELVRLDPANVDRLVSFDPLIVPTAEEVMPVWRSLPIPVADRLYRPVRRLSDPPRMIFVGRSTIHREEYLREVKHRFDCLHVAFGIEVEELERLLERREITFNVHNEQYPSFEYRVLLHLAAGHLVISEPLSPRHGLEPGVHYLEVDSPEALTAAAARAVEHPDEMLEIRRRGRERAEAFRASRVWPELVGGMLADIAEAGTHRRRVPEGPPVTA